MRTLLCIALSVCVTTLSAAQEIKDLPGVNWPLNFKHYSGFFQVSPTHFLHYWFVESQNKPLEDPVIFWFNGGPGCSSLDGLLNEMGPYVSNPDGKTLDPNPHSWNKFASVVYIEAPAGVGYSYSTDGNTTTNDDQTSAENYAAVKLFFKTFTEFRAHKVFIMGESYGGVYVPSLTARIVDGLPDFPINLAGMAIGNGYVNAKLNVDTSVRYAYGHGIVDQKTWKTIEDECCHGCADTCDFASFNSTHCARMIQDVFKFVWFGGLNPYDLYRNCDPNPDVNSRKMTALLKGLADLAVDDFPDFAVQQTNAFVDNGQILYGDVPCLNDSDVIVYMNRADVRKALHIPDHLPRWDICSNTVTRTYQKQYGDTKPFFDKIIKANVRVLLYYGDTDMACNFLMGQIFADNLGLPRQLTKTAWKFNKQIAGFKTLYGHHLRHDVSFITVKGAGHMAPQWRAAPMQYVINQFLINHPI